MAPSPPPKTDLRLLAFLFLLELSIAIMATAMYMKCERPFSIFLSSNPGVLFVRAVPALLIAGAVIIHQYVASKRSPSNHFRLTVMMNLVTVILIVITGEIATRIGSRSYNQVETVMSTVLLPNNWEMVALHHRGLLDPASGKFPFLVYDDLMGWTAGPNKRSADGLYWTSSEGIRAPHAGATFAKHAGKTRIALVGDSYTFGNGVTYEDSWGYLFEKALGSEFQVLNFGVGGYGQEALSLPMGPHLDKRQLQSVIDAVKEALRA